MAKLKPPLSKSEVYPFKIEADKPDALSQFPIKLIFHSEGIMPDMEKQFAFWLTLGQAWNLKNNLSHFISDVKAQREVAGLKVETKTE